MAEKEANKADNQGRKTYVPLISTADDLIGKRVRHLCEEDGIEQWHFGVVKNFVMRKSVPVFPIIYVDCQTLNQFPLLSDLQKG